MNGNQGRSHILQRLGTACLLAATVVLLPDAFITAEDPFPVARARLGTSSRTGTLADVEYAGLKLDGGSELMVVSPQEWRSAANSLMATLEDTHTKYVSLFGSIPKFSITVRLMDEETFYLSTGAPAWTNAMFFKGQIIIPVSRKGILDQDNLFRSIRHEYTHAVIHALSGGTCPGWIDEGLAQWAEGEPNPLLNQALNEWLVENPPVPLKLLQGGFTKLPTEMVPAAYAQSLAATRILLQKLGMAGFRDLFQALREGKDSEEAFKIAFGTSAKHFEGELKTSLPALLNHRRVARVTTVSHTYAR